MDKELLKSMGFQKEVKKIENNKCPFCNKLIKISDFTDELSKKEFKISGLCQTCQNEFFN